jgi:NAD(P)-dependent dehydrogenase (short-subunit alcohol dehydrogenase family)
MSQVGPSGRVAVVTGGGAGIGRSLVRAFAKAGMRVAIADLDAGAADAVAREVRSAGGEAISVRCDVSRFEEVERLASEARERLGPVGVLCNNAGIGGGIGPAIAELEGEVWDRVLGVNLQGVIHGVRAFVPRMIQDSAGGHVVNTASLAAFLPAPGSGPYTTSKFAVVGLSEVLRAELAPHGIGVSVLCPGPYDTGIWGRDRSSDRGADPAILGPRVLLGIEANEPFIFTHPEFAARVSERFERIATHLRDAGRAMELARRALGEPVVHPRVEEGQ